MDSIRSHKFRSFLTILGIVVGVITAIVVASILTGMRNSIVAIVEEYGTNNIYAYHLSTGPGPRSQDERNRKPLTDDDATAILAQSTAIQDLTTAAPNIGSFNGGFDDNLSFTKAKNYRWADRRCAAKLHGNDEHRPPFRQVHYRIGQLSATKRPRRWSKYC
ncbi:MAG: ABC transporter permease [Acidobacteria bacterium]|nr:ABC transporter permease [Acidobacteriota bacterium]